MPRTPSPFRYPGGKTSTYKFIRELILKNNSTTYIEPFAGGAGVAISLLLNNDVKKIIINDVDKSIYAFWYAVKYHSDSLIKMIEKSEISTEQWFFHKNVHNYKDTFDDLLQLGFSTLFLNRTNRSGIIKGGIMGGKDQTGTDKIDCRFNKKELIRKIEKISEKADCIDVYNLDTIDFIDNVIKNTKKSFTFFDPPYYKKGPSLYTNFYNSEDHKKLAKKIQKELRNRKWIVTYDYVPEIKKMYESLPYIEYYLNYSAQQKTKGIEYMFFSKKTNMCDPNDFLRLFNPKRKL